MKVLWRVIAVLIFVAITVWPGFGLAALAYTNLTGPNPQFLLVLLGAAIWTIIFTTLLPLKLREYRRSTMVALTVVAAIAYFQALQMQLFRPDDVGFWLISLALTGAFIFIAWPAFIATPLWQALHFQRAVDPQNADHSAGDGGHH